MDLISSVGFVVLAFAQRSTAPAAVLAEARKAAGSLTTRTERSVAFLAIAQAQNGLQDRKGALQSLRIGWTAYEKGSDKGLSEGDRFDSHTLFDHGDFSMLPVEYAYEFVVAGDQGAARRAAMSLGMSDLADSYRQGLRDRLRVKYPQAVETVTLTAEQQARRAARKKRIVDSLSDLRAEADPSKRSYGLYEAAGELERLGDAGQALALLREAAEASDEIAKIEWRTTNDAQIADALWRLGAKAEAKVVLARSEKSLAGIPNEGERQKARFFVEQAKRSMGLPNHFDSPSVDRSGAPIAMVPGPGLKPSENSAYNLLSEAERQIALGDLAAAKKTLRRIKVAPGGDSWIWVLLGELQAKVGDREMARINLSQGSRWRLSQIQPQAFLDRESLNGLVRIAEAQTAGGDRSGALATLSQGVKRMAGPIRWVTMPHMGDGGGQMVRHDRLSPVLHAGAIALAKSGFYVKAVEMARTIPGAAHRAIALAGAVRDGIPSTKR